MPACPWEGFFSAAQLKRWSEAIPLRFACRRFSAPAGVDQQITLAYTAARVSLPGVRLALLDCDSNRLFLSLPFFPRIEYARQYVAVIIDTGVSRAQNWANIMALHEAEITEFSIAGPRDGHTCQYCWAMLGRTFSVETEHTRIQEIIDSGDEDISKFHKFITSRFGTNAGLESLKSATDADVQASGMVTPPIHPLCRHRLVAVVKLASSNRRVNVYTPTVAFIWQEAA